MPRTVRPLIVLLVIATAVISAALGYRAYSTRRVARATAATVAGPDRPVRIVTDRWGIPHLQASSLPDLYYAWGWVTARDRLWQLAYARRAARGELWEWLGNSKLRDDGGAQLFELAARAHALWERERSEPEVRVPLERFAAGVNRYIDECRRGVHPWPRELIRLHRRADPWRPEDSYLLLLAQGMVLDFAVPEFGERDAIAEHGLEWMERRTRFEPALEIVTIPDSAAARLWPARGSKAAVDDVPPGVRPATRSTGTTDVEDAPLASRAAAALGSWGLARAPDDRASNVFAVAAGRSTSGRPLLANDPHLDLAVPGPLHVIHVSVPGQVDAIGACVPGLPSLVSGRNRRVAWGITALSADVIDVYADTLAPDGARMRWRGGWTPLREAPFNMRYRLPGGLTLPLFGQSRRYGPRGPVLVYDRRHHVAYEARWAVDDRAIGLGRLLGLERSASAAELAERYRTQVTPGLDVVAADVAGDVIYEAVGEVPRRGFTPAPGPLPTDGAHEWAGFVPPDSMPRWTLPGHGFVVNANNLPARAPGLEPWPRFDWAQDRAAEIERRLAALDPASATDLAAIQNDVYALTASRLVPRLLHALEPRAALVPRERAAFDTLAAWDYVSRRDRVAPTLFRAWYGALQRRSQLGGLVGLTMAALDGRAPEALPKAGGGRETRSFAARAALDTALTHLDALLGPDLASWQWGRAHRARFHHPLAERDSEFNLPRIAADGDRSSPCVGPSSLPWSVEFDHAPVFRHVVDLAEPDSSLGIVTPGNSGVAASGHATDLLARWRDHQYVPFLLDWKRIEAERESEQMLLPER